MRETASTQRYHDAWHLMHPVSVQPASPSRAAGFLLALESFADEVCGTLARLFAYAGVLALIGILLVAGWREFGGFDDAELGGPGWAIADGAVPAYALRLADQPDKSATYTVLRHPDGGRKDIIRWGEPAERPALAELEVYRFGGEPDVRSDPLADLARRMAVRGASAFEAAGVIDSKFGTIGLLRLANTSDGAGACLGFLKGVRTPGLRISGWSCLGVEGPVQRAAVGCMLNRLTLLSTGHDTEMTDLFTSAEQKRTACGAGTAGGSAAGGPADWVTTFDNPRLRGIL
jgi:hypothetical protein